MLNRIVLKRAAFAACITLASLAGAGCETTHAVVGASQKGLGALSCQEIYRTFDAYDRDKQTLQAAKELSTALGIPYTGGSAGDYYQTAKTSANVALMAQGCEPLQ